MFVYLIGICAPTNNCTGGELSDFQRSAVKFQWRRSLTAKKKKIPTNTVQILNVIVNAVLHNETEHSISMSRTYFFGIVGSIESRSRVQNNNNWILYLCWSFDFFLIERNVCRTLPCGNIWERENQKNATINTRTFRVRNK